MCFILFISIGCGKTQKLKENLPEIKTPQALAACEELKIPRDIAFNGKFLFNLSHCVSNKTKTGEESLPGTIGLLDAMGVAGLDKLTTLLLLNPKPANLNGRTEYPYLRTFLTLAERGSVVDGVLSPDLYHERFELMQLLSEKLNPYWGLNLVLELNENGRLEKFLNILSPLLLDGIDTQSMFAMVNQTLINPKMKDITVSIVDQIFLNDGIYSPLKKLITLQPTYSLPQKVQEKCLAIWLDPLPKGATDNCFQGEDLVGSGQTETANDRFERALNKLSDEDILNVSRLVSDISNDLITMDSKERLAVLKKLSNGSRGVINIQEGPLRNLIGFLEFFAGEKGGIQNVKVSDLDDIMAGLKESIDETGSDAVKALNQKMGASKLHNLLEQLIVNGGTVQGCNLVLPALKNIDFYDPEKFFKELSVYILPNPNCENGLSPAATFYFDTINRRIGLDKECKGPDDNYYKESCLDSENLQNIQKKISEIDHSGLIEAVEPEPEVLKELLLTTLKEIKVNLEKDPYYLHWLHFAEGKVGSNIIDFVIEKASSLENYNIISVAQLDLLLSEHVVTRNVLREDFLENILVKKIEDLKTVSNQFQGLFEGSKKGNENALRIFSGAYFKGPLEDVLRANLYPELIGSSILDSFKGDDFAVAELLGRTRLEGILINNPRLTPDDSENDLRLLGDKNRSTDHLFNYNSVNSSYVFNEIGFTKAPIQLKDILGQSYLRFDKILFDNPLIGINVKTTKGDEFDYWVKNILYTGIKKNSFWSSRFTNPTQLEGLDLNFFNKSPYSSQKVREIALFYSKNFLFADGSLPKNEESYSFPRVRMEKFSNINLTRLRLPQENGVWNGHIAYFPNFLQGNNQFQTLDDLRAKLNLIWERDSYNQIPWKLLPSDRKNERDLDFNSFSSNGLEIIKTLSTLDLFTTNRKLKYMPFLGMDKECTLPNQETSACPINFLDTKGPDGETINALTHYKEFILKSFLSNYCPLLFKGDKVYRFSDSFYDLMFRNLKLDISQETLNLVCKDNKNLFEGLSDNLPSWYHERVLSDIINVGENPKLKKGLEGLGVHLKYYKNLGKYPNDPENFVRSILNSKGYLPAEYLVYYVRESRDHRGFHTIFPGMLNVYLNYLFNVSLGEGSKLDIALAHYGADILVSEDLNQGTAQDFLVNTVIASQRAYPDRDANALELIFEILKNLNPRQLDAISSLVAYPQDIESLSNFTGTYSIFLKFLMGQTPSGTFWQKPGSQALKQLMRQETVRAMVDLLKDFNLTEIRKAFRSLHGSVVKNIKTPKEAIKIIRVSKDFLKEQFLSFDNGKTNAQEIEEAYKKIFIEIYQNLSTEDMNYLMDQMARNDLESFDGKKAEPFYKNNQALTFFAIKNIFKIVDTYQGHFTQKKIRGKNDENYFKNLVLSIIRPTRGVEANPGLRALSNFLKDPKLGTWKELFAPMLFKQPFQEIMLSVLKAASKINTKDVRLGLDETGVLLPTTHNTLVFVKQRMQWKENTAQEVIDSIDVFNRLSVPDNAVWNKQNLLLRNWLTQYEQVK